MSTSLSTDGPAEGAMLLRVAAVRAEGRVRVAVRATEKGALRESPRGRGGVRLRGVVDVGCVEFLSADISFFCMITKDRVETIETASVCSLPPTPSC